MNKIQTINEMCSEIHNQNVAVGWWTKEDQDLARSFPDATSKECANLIAAKLCLVHSEVSEALEGMRKGLMDDHLKHRTMLEVELADTVIRIMDLAGYLNLDLGGAIEEKFQYNKTRADHKLSNRAEAGGKKI